MNKILIKSIIFINKFFPKKEHPFNTKKGGILNLNYSDFEYNNTKSLLEMYSEVINLDDLRGKKILDIGCGGGGKAVYIAEKYGSKIIGIDINLTFLDQAITKAKEKKVEDLVMFKKENALNLSFKNDSFDIIIMSDVIEHIPKTEILFKEIYRVLKKGGMVIFDFAPYYHYFGHHIWDTIRIPWLHLFTTEDLRVKLYKESVKGLVDGDARIDLRIGKKTIGTSTQNKEVFDYLNGISRKKFEKIISKELGRYSYYKINYKMLKNINIFSNIPILRELFIKHIIGVIKK